VLAPDENEAPPVSPVLVPLPIVGAG